MLAKYKHGGGYKQAALDEGINWNQVTDYSTSINWKATEFYPENLIYIHQETMEYPDPNYPDLKEVIANNHGYSSKHFLLTHGANEAIYSLFHMFLLLGYKDKQVILVGPTYSEYNKYSDLNGFSSIKISYQDFNDKLNTFKNKIIVIVNPNTPVGEHYELKPIIEKLQNSGSILVIDESFINFTDKPSVIDLVENNPNLYVIHSMTKFYGSAGARLGLILSSNPLLQEYLSILLPPWTISAYDKWFYKNMIIQYNKIKSATIDWVKDLNIQADEVTRDLKNTRKFSESISCYRTLEINPDILKGESLRKFFLKNYKIYVRPTSDFYGCPEYSFRVGLRLPRENEPLWNALRDIG